jgi:hypothetical protein
MRKSRRNITSSNIIRSEDLPVMSRTREQERQSRDQVDIILTITYHKILGSRSLRTKGISLIPDIHNSFRELDGFRIDIKSEFNILSSFEEWCESGDISLHSDHIT